MPRVHACLDKRKTRQHIDRFLVFQRVGRESFCSHTATACLRTLKSNATWYESVVLICCQLCPRRIWQYLVWLRSANMGLLIRALACVRGLLLAISRLTRARNFGRRFVNIASRRASKDIARSSSFVCFASALPHTPSALSSVTPIDLKACRVIGMLQPFSSEIQTQLSTMPCFKKCYYSLWTYTRNCFFVHSPSPTKPCFLRENAMSKKIFNFDLATPKKGGRHIPLLILCRQKMSVTQKVWELKGKAFLSQNQFFEAFSVDLLPLYLCSIIALLSCFSGGFSSCNSAHVVILSQNYSTLLALGKVR